MNYWLNRFFYSISYKLASIFGYKLISFSEYSYIQKNQVNNTSLELITKIKPSLINVFIQNIKSSKSQIAQDLFVLSELGFKKKGFFVEFGATDGIEMSNTYLLEKKFNWNGILSEPAKKWHKQLLKNRNVFIERNAVWITSDESLNFLEVDELSISTIEDCKQNDPHAKKREKNKKYKVKTISLEDLLIKYNAPKVIDYLSIDTEGSEFEILANFNFEKYKFKVITCEHNYTINREKIFNLLTSKGYIRKNTNLSRFDDWYVLK